MNIHFIGIGGIGVSALARYYLEKGHKISGSDLVSSEITDALKEKGAKLLIGKHKAGNLAKDVDLVIYSPAVPKNNPELLKAYNLQSAICNLQVMSYPEALGELTKKYFTIAVCGTHGKSTITAMISLILIKAGLNPTVIVGTKLKEFGDSNFRTGGFPKSNYSLLTTNYPLLIIEADEHFASFLNYRPKIIVLTALEADHLDYYKNFKNYILSFKKFIFHLPKDGTLIANKDDKNIRRILNPKSKIQISKQIQNSKSKTIYYSLKQKEIKKLEKILKVPGEHNVANALAALATARALKIPDKISFKALSEFRGSWRRFEIKQLTINNKQLTIISDYAHHPTKIRVTLKATREKFPNKKIWLVFQPHQYQRTYYLFDDFVEVFEGALKKSWINRLIVTDIFDVAGREEKEIKKKVSSKKLINKIKNLKLKIKNSVIYVPTVKTTADYLRKNLQGKEVVIVMGAGDVYKLVDLLIDKTQK